MELGSPRFWNTKVTEKSIAVEWMIKKSAQRKTVHVHWQCCEEGHRMFGRRSEPATHSANGASFTDHEVVMEPNANPTPTEVNRLPAANGLALIRVTIGAMFVWVFFENLGKGLYRPAGYAGLISYYIQHDHAPGVWKAVMGLAASHAAMAAPLQAVTEISLGVLLIIGLLTRPVAFVAFLYLGSLWVSEWGTTWIWELLVPVLASLGLAIGSAGRRWGVDAWLSQRWPSSLWW
jgi:uncharacterized membrane protein YphA (DoxX/SURF4 family)